MTTNNNKMIKGIHHIAIRARNFDSTMDFYLNALDFTISHEWSLPEFNLKRAAMLKSADGNSFIELYDQEADIAAQGRKIKDGEEFVQTALLHICMCVEDCSIAFERAIRAGGKPCIEPMVLHLGNPAVTVRNSLVYSPNGEVIEFLEKADF